MRPVAKMWDRMLSVSANLSNCCRRSYLKYALAIYNNAGRGYWPVAARQPLSQSLAPIPSTALIGSTWTISTARAPASYLQINILAVVCHHSRLVREVPGLGQVSGRNGPCQQRGIASQRAIPRYTWGRPHVCNPLPALSPVKPLESTGNGPWTADPASAGSGAGQRRSRWPAPERALGRHLVVADRYSGG